MFHTLLTTDNIVTWADHPPTEALLPNLEALEDYLITSNTKLTRLASPTSNQSCILPNLKLVSLITENRANYVKSMSASLTQNMMSFLPSVQLWMTLWMILNETLKNH